MAFELPKLPYDYNALSPHISGETLKFHHDKHHQAYVNKTNKLIEGTAFENSSLEEIIKKADGGIYNNGAQIWNHTFFFESFNPHPMKKPTGKLLDQIDNQFGSFDEFRNKFTDQATSLFGSGWTWLVKKSDGSLDIINESNAGNPLRSGHTPLMTLDVWEHAYYLDYQNKRPDYVDGFWHVIDWEKVQERYG
ncbi:MAG: superoxide dismutase [Bacteroidota bacterium]